MKTLSKSKTLRYISLMIFCCFALFTLNSQAADYYLTNGDGPISSDLQTIFNLTPDTLDGLFVTTVEYPDLISIFQNATSQIPDYEFLCLTNLGQQYLPRLSDLLTYDLSICDFGIAIDQHSPIERPTIFTELFTALGINQSTEPTPDTDPTAIEVNAKLDEILFYLVGSMISITAILGFKHGSNFQF